MKGIVEIDPDGTKWYTLHGLPHRDDYPAGESPIGDKVWFQHGKYHRLNGPAMEFASGDQQWFYEGQEIDCKNQQEFERYIKLLVFR